MYYCNISEHCAKKWILKQSLERNYDIKMLYREIKCTKKTFFYFLFFEKFFYWLYAINNQCHFWVIKRIIFHYETG